MTAVDVLGPASLNAVLTRPSDARSFGTTGDTYFKDCTTPSSQDGTEVLSGWLNSMTGQLRLLIRANGLKLNGIDPVVTYDQGDDMALRALEHLIQRGTLNSGLDTGSANNVVVNLPVTPAELIPGIEVCFKAAAAPTGSTQMIVSGFPAAPVLRRGNQALIGGEWAAGDWVRVRYTNGPAWQIAGLVSSDVLSTAVIQPIIAQFQGRGALAVRGLSTQSIVNGIETAIAFDQEVLDTDNSFSTSDPTKLYVPAGVSRVRIQVQVLFEANSTGSRKMRVLRNSAIEGGGLQSQRFAAAASDDVSILNGAGAIVAVTPGDYFQVGVTQTSGAALNIRGDTNTWVNMEILK